MSIPSVLRLKANSIYEFFAICVYALPLFASVCTGIAQAQPTQDNAWQYSVALEKGTERRAYLWIPPRCKHVRSVLIGLQNMHRSERQITLTATSSSGLSVQFYVESGPAFVEDNTLHLLALPPRSRYPVRVIVSSYQWGRIGEHPIQSAGPETQEFFIQR